MALLTRPPATTRLNVEDFLAIASQPEYADCRVELVEGEIVTMPFNNALHGWIVIFLGGRLSNFVAEHRLGLVTGADAGFVLGRNPDGRDTVRGLDIAFISHEKAPDPLTATLLEVTPDLVIEVISPSNTADDIRLKVHQLLQAGCEQVWVVYPSLREVDVHSAAGIRSFREGDSLSAPASLPGFEIAVSDIFPA